MQESYVCSTNLGDIKVTRNTICKIIENSVKEFDGRVFIANKKGKTAGFTSKIGMSDQLDNIIVEVDHDKMYITLYVLVKFGTSINGACDKITSSIHKQLHSVIGDFPMEISFNVSGTLSKNIVRREIKIVKTYEN